MKQFLGTWIQEDALRALSSTQLVHELLEHKRKCECCNCSCQTHPWHQIVHVYQGRMT